MSKLKLYFCIEGLEIWNALVSMHCIIYFGKYVLLKMN